MKIADYIIVLGNPAKEDGSVGEIMRERMLKAIELYREGFGNCILVSGGAVVNKFTEAEIMAEYAYNKNIPADKLILETKSTNTFENARNSYKILKPVEDLSVLVVTSPFHVKRSRLLFSYFFKNLEVVGCETNVNYSFTQKIRHFVLERALYYKLKFFGSRRYKATQRF